MPNKFMRTDFQIALSRLASKELQIRYCINATPEEYLLPEELFNSAFNWATTLADRDEFNFSEKDAVNKFIIALDELSKVIPFNDEMVSVENLILSNSHWVSAREAAVECLNALDMELNLSM